VEDIMVSPQADNIITTCGFTLWITNITENHINGLFRFQPSLVGLITPVDMFEDGFKGEAYE